MFWELFLSFHNMFLEFVHTVKYSDFSWCWFIFHTKSLLQRQTHWSASSEQNKRWVKGHRNIELYDFKDMKNTVLHLFLPLPLQPSLTCPSPPKSHSLYSSSSFLIRECYEQKMCSLGFRIEVEPTEKMLNVCCTGLSPAESCRQK